MAKENLTSGFVGVKDVREGAIIREDGSLVGVLLVNSINFSLKSDEEREAVIGGFQNLLNTLSTDVQILVQSRNANIESYVQTLKSMEKTQNNELLKLQLSGYRQFIEDFVSNSDILTKNFFLIIAYTPIKLKKGAFSFLSFGKKTQEEEDRNFLEDLGQLQQRMASMQQRLSSMGLRSIQIDSEQAIRLLYETFNPEEV